MKLFTTYFGFWLLNDITAGKTINNAKIRIKRSGGRNTTQTVRLYPVTVSSIPSDERSVNQVYDTSWTCGTAQMGLGTTAWITLNQRAVNALNGSGSERIYGVGVIDDMNISRFDASAVLKINEQ